MPLGSVYLRKLDEITLWFVDISLYSDRKRTLFSYLESCSECKQLHDEEQFYIINYVLYFICKVIFKSIDHTMGPTSVPLQILVNCGGGDLIGSRWIINDFQA